jgi:hypothetical protein
MFTPFKRKILRKLTGKDTRSMTNEKIRAEILEITQKLGAAESSIVCGSLFCKLTSNELATQLKETLQKFFDSEKPNDTNVKMSTLIDNEYAYDFVPAVNYKFNYGI